MIDMLCDWGLWGTPPPPASDAVLVPQFLSLNEELQGVRVQENWVEISLERVLVLLWDFIRWPSIPQEKPRELVSLCLAFWGPMNTCLTWPRKSREEMGWPTALVAVLEHAAACTLFRGPWIPRGLWGREGELAQDQQGSSVKISKET